MIGEAYFDLRTRLGTDLFKLAQLVREHGGSQDDVQILENLIASLNDPFVFVVVGEVNVGKSTFLNALFGADFSRTGVMPTTDKVLFFKHGPVLQTIPVSPTVDEVRVPCTFLKDFHIVDTPGTNSIEHEHQQITERFVPAADLVIFVFSAMNPWGASAWQFLEKVHRQWMRHVVFVLQQCDLRSPEEIQVITDYMRQLCQQRFGREFPLFPISAKKAYLARSSGLDTERLLNESGFINLESHINEVVTRHASRLAKLNSSLRIARQVLDQLIERTQHHLNTLAQRRQVLTELQAERAVQVERTQAKFQSAVEASDHDFLEAANRVKTSVEPNLSVAAAFRASNDDTRLPPNLDHRLYQDLLAHIGERWHQMAAVLEEDFKRFENYMSHHWKGELYLSELKGRDESEPASQEARRRFISKVESTLRRFVLGLQIQETLEPGLKKSRTQARRIPRILVLLLALTGLVFWLSDWQTGLIAVAIVAFLGLLMLLGLRTQLRSLHNHLFDQFEIERDKLRASLHDQARDETEHAFSVFTRILEPSLQDLELTGQRSGQQLTRLRDLQQSMQKLGEELHGSPVSA